MNNSSLSSLYPDSNGRNIREVLVFKVFIVVLCMVDPVITSRQTLSREDRRSSLHYEDLSYNLDVFEYNSKSSSRNAPAYTISQPPRSYLKTQLIFIHYSILLFISLHRVLWKDSRNKPATSPSRIDLFKTNYDWTLQNSERKSIVRPLKSNELRLTLKTKYKTQPV